MAKVINGNQDVNTNGLTVIGTDRIQRGATSPAAKVQTPVLSTEELLQQAMAQLNAANARIEQLQKASTNVGKITVRFNDRPTVDPKTQAQNPAKFGFSLLGIQRFPLTLYASQWVRLLEHANEIVECLSENIDKASVKDESERETLAERLEGLSAVFDKQES